MFKLCLVQTKAGVYACSVLLQAKYIAQMVVAGMQIVGRAFIKAVQTEMRSSQQAAQARSSSGKTNIRSAATDALSGMTVQVSFPTSSIIL